jgi:UPF0271 protein
MTTMIDLNADLGEGFGPYDLTDDDGLLDIVTSANIACGMHAGDATTMVRVCRMAGERGVVIGAHPGYADREGFGRRHIPMSADDIEALVAIQIGALQAAAALSGNSVRYVKPHGALYTLAEKDMPVANAICRAAQACCAEMAVMCSPKSALLVAAADFGLTAVAEGFADRRYQPDGTLVPRSRPHAVFENLDQIVDQALQLAQRQDVTSDTGEPLQMTVRTICLHGDGRMAMAAASAVRARLEASGIVLAPFLGGLRNA